MPLFTIRWANRSNSTQDWRISNGDTFSLQADYVREANININNDYTFQIAVDTDSRFTAAALTYIAATQTWQLNSQTPNEWQLATGNKIVTVRCLLENAELTGNEVEYVPYEPTNTTI